jgi:accessory colonization factor AcfC
MTINKVKYAFAFLFLIPFITKAQTDTMYVYGPGGPFGPINECGQMFGKQINLFIKVTGGPEGKWIEDAKKNADVIFGGAEYMLTSFAMKHPGMVDSSTRTELYKRGAAILVRPGNPKHISSLKDLTKSGIAILDVNGSGQLGLWEDLAGKQDLIGGIQKNIRQSFENTALGIEAWKKDPQFDAWITYTSWYYRLKEITQAVKLPQVINAYRGTPVALTMGSQHKNKATQFIGFMQTGKGHAIFKKWGWE